MSRFVPQSFADLIDHSLTTFDDLNTPETGETAEETLDASTLEDTSANPMPNSMIFIGVALIVLALVGIVVLIRKLRRSKKYERGLKMVPLLIHLPPQTDDINSENGRDKRDIANEAISKAQVMYSILYGTIAKGLKSKVYGQRHFSLEIIARDGFIRYYAIVPAVLTETVCQAIQSAYPTARIEEKREENIFKGGSGLEAFAGAELTLTREGYYPIATYEDTKRDGQTALLNALTGVTKGEGASVQILFRPAQKNWSEEAKKYMENVQKGKETHGFAGAVGNLALDVLKAPWEPPEERKKEEDKPPITGVKQNELEAITNKLRYPAFETMIRIVASSASMPRSEAIVGGLVSAFSQYNSPELNGFKAEYFTASKKLFMDYALRSFNVRTRGNILNSVELATIFHLPEQNAIPNSQVERQLTKQVDGPAKLATEGLLLGTNEFRGVKKPIYLTDDDRRRHMYVIGQTGMGKSVFLENLAFQDMCDGRGFAFIDPHGDAVEAILQRVPEERIDDVIYFDPADIDHPVGMNMFEFSNPDQKDFIVQEGISMLQSLFDPNNQGFFGARGQHMFRNAALLLMADPAGATFIDIPQCFTDAEFVKAKLKYVTDKAVYDYWTREFPESKKSSDSGEVITWFASKWGPFISNTIMRNTLGQVKSGFNIREIMDNNKIFLVNLSKGRLGDINANLLGMIFVMKFQQAAMSRQDIPEHERKDFCLYVDEFQNFATDSFESILSEARKYRLNLIVANQFMTQLTDKIREALLGNVGTIICGRVGVTDADLMVKAFTPIFTAEDLTKTPNHAAVCKAMMFGMPSSAFTMLLPPPMGEPNDELMKSLKAYSATKYAKTRAEVEQEITERWNRGHENQPGGGASGVGSGAAGAAGIPGASGISGASGAPSGGASIVAFGPNAGTPVAPGTNNLPPLNLPGNSPGNRRGPAPHAMQSPGGIFGQPAPGTQYGQSGAQYNQPNAQYGPSGTQYGQPANGAQSAYQPASQGFSGASNAASNAFSGQSAYGAQSSPSAAPTPARRPRGRFLDQWLSAKPAKPAPAAAPTPVTNPPRPHNSASASHSRPATRPQPAPIPASAIVSTPDATPTPTASFMPPRPRPTTASRPSVEPQPKPELRPTPEPTPQPTPESTPAPEPPRIDLNEIDDTDDAPPPPQESEGISLQVPEPDSTPEDEVVFRIH